MASGKRDNDAKSRGLADQKEEVNGAVLQYQNQKLVQQLDAQKNEMHALEEKFKKLKDNQISYDRTLITVNKIWNQLVDDLVLLGIRAGGHPDGLQALNRQDCPADAVAACPPEETFLCRLLKAGLVEKNEGNETIKYVPDALAQRHSFTMNLMKDLQETIATQQANTGNLVLALHEKVSSEDAIVQLQKLDDLLGEQADRLRQSIDAIHQLHKQYADEISGYLDNNSRDQAEIKRLSGELEESMAELEESRQKLVILQMQKHGMSLLNASVANGSDLPVKLADKTMDLRELTGSVEEAKLQDSEREAMASTNIPGDVCQERPLFGSAVSSSFPLRFHDLNDIPQIPDNHEAFADPSGDESLVFELLELKPEIEDGGSAVWFLRDLVLEQDSEESMVLEHSSAVEAASLSLPAVCTTAIGQMAISKGRQGREAQNIVRVYLANLRLKQVASDVLIVAFEPLLINPLTESARTMQAGLPTPAAQSGCLPMAEVFRLAVTSFKVHNWGLFAPQA